ncbi:MAG: biotin synthase BioB [Myxococcales bacterium]|nr:biotin synthase BioB [Myxococcales bacterium]
MREHDYARGGIDRALALELETLEGPDLWDLFSTANRVRHERVGDEVHLCGIINAKSGHCPEDCAFCAQSRHFTTGIKTYPYLPTDDIVAGSRVAADQGATRFGIVTATRDLEPGKFLDRVVESIRAIAADGRVQADASLGIIRDPDVAVRLREAGMVEINHNLETSRRFFPNVCSTHSYDERIATLKYAKQAGLKLCSGGIFGMGETWEDRVDLLLELRDLEVYTVPLNFLHRIEGTPLDHCEPMSPMEILRSIAMARLVMPDAEIKVAGGREVNLRTLQPLMFAAGANSTMVGNYLTTSGWSHETDHEMIRDMGLTLSSSCQD